MKLTFNNFLIVVNRRVNKELGCSVNDLADFNYSDYWDDDCSKYEIEFNYAVDSCVDDLMAECEIDSNSWGIQGVDY